MNGERASQERRRLGELAPRLQRAGFLVGLAGLGATVALGLLQGRKALFEAYVINLAYFVSLALGCLFFVLVHHATRAGWSVPVRRVAEAMAANLGLLWVLALPLLACMLFLDMGFLYHWVHPQGDELLEHKFPYLNVPFFVIRMLVFFLLWTLMSRFYFRTSVAQDETGEVELTLKMQRVSYPCLLIFGLTLTFFAFDLLMSLHPHWYSTIFGVYYFAGSAVGFFALAVVVLMYLQSRGLLAESIRVEQYHDLGKWLFAFTVFWAYIGYSQYMLIWYGNIPEETIWYSFRQQGQWGTVSLFLVLGHFAAPFLFLLSRHTKRRRGALLAGAIWMLAMHWLDMFWLVRPAEGLLEAPLYAVDLTALAGFGGLFVAAAAGRLADRALIPERDPRLPEALAYENP